MRARGWKPSGFPIAALLAALLLARGGHHRSGATATASAEVSAEPPKALLEGAAAAWPSTRAPRRAATTTPSASSRARGRLAAPPLRESSGVAETVTRRKRADIFPRWLKRYDVYEDLAALYGLDRAGGDVRRSGGGVEADKASDQEKQGSRRKNKTEANDKVHAGVKRNRTRSGSKSSAHDNDRKGNVSGGAFEKSRTATTPPQPTGRGPISGREQRNKANHDDPKGPVAQDDTQEGNQSKRSSVRQESRKVTLMTGRNASQGPQVSSTIRRGIESSLTPVSSKTMTVSPTEAFYGETTTLTSMEREEAGAATLEPDSLYDMIMKAVEESTIETPTESPFADSTQSSLEQDFSFGNVDGLLAHISKLSQDGSDQIVTNKKQRLAVLLPNNPRLRLAHPENLTPSDIVQIIDADMLDVVADDQQDMAALAREDDEETREIGDLDLDDDESDGNDEDDDELVAATAPPREQETAATEVDDETLDDTELRERYRQSEHEDIPDPPTRPNYTHEGLWAKPPPDVDIDFVPLQILTQVRRYDTVRHLTPEDAIAEATTDEEEANAPRLKEVVSHRKTSEVYSEEGYEDSGYDHGGYNKEGEHHEVVPGFEASAIMVKQPSDGEEAAESRDHMVSNSEPRGTRLAAPGAANGTAADPARNKTRHGTQQITRGSWSIRQVAEDDAGRSVVLQEGGNITQPTTLRPVFPAGGRYAAHAPQQGQAQRGQAQEAQAQEAQAQRGHQAPLQAQAVRKATEQGRHGVRQSTQPQTNSTALQSKQKPPAKKLKRRRKRPKLRKSKKKKAQKVHSQLLGFKYPADRKKPISKGKSNSPLAKAKRKRKMKERAKKRRKMSLIKAERERKRLQRLNAGGVKNTTNNNSTGKPSAPPKENPQIMNKSAAIGKLVEPRNKQLSHFGNELHPNHRYDKSSVNQKKLVASSKSIPAYNALQNAEKANSPSRTGNFFFNQKNWLPMEAENLVKPPGPNLHPNLSAKWAKEIEKRQETIHQPFGAYNAQATKPPKPVHFTVAALAAMHPNVMQVNVAESSGRKQTLESGITATHKLYDSQRGDKTIFGKTSNTSPQFIGPVDKSHHFLGQTLPDIRWDMQNYNPMIANSDFAPKTSTIVTNPPTFTGNVDLFRAEDGQIHIGKKLVNVLQDPLSTLVMLPTARRFQRSSGLQGNSYEPTAVSNASERNALQVPHNETSRSNAGTRRTRFPRTEAIQRLERRVISNLKTGNTKVKPISTKIKLVPPVVNKSNRKPTTNNLEQQKLRLLKVMDMDHWKNQSRGRNASASSTQLHNTTDNVSSNAPNPSQLRRTNTEETAYPRQTELIQANLESTDDTNVTMETGHDNEQEASMRNPKFALPDIRTDLRKYPFYRAPTSEKLSSYTPLRYATNPYDVPIKSEGGMEFYESREKLVRCEEPRKPENVVPERDEDGEWNKKPQPNGPRMGNLGDVIGCKRIQLFGENPLDNPFFKETSVGLPEETALIGALVDAGGTPAPKLHDQLGFYSDILENIRHSSIGPNPAEVRNRPYIRVGSSPFDSDEASSEAINVRVAYNVPDNGKQTVYAPRVQSPKFTHSSNSDEDQHAEKGESADVDYPDSESKDDTHSKLAAELQESAEEDSKDTDQTVKRDKDSSESTSVEYYVDVHGRPVYFYTGSTLEKSKESKKGVKDMVYHNIVRPISSESVEYEVNTAAKEPYQKKKDEKGIESTGNKKKSDPTNNDANKSNKASLAISNQDQHKKRKKNQLSSDSTKISRQNSYKEALKNSKAVTDLKKQKTQRGSKFLSQNLPLPPISSSVLKELKNSNVTLENFLHSPPSREKNSTQSLKEPGNYDVDNHTSKEKSHKEAKRNDKQNSSDAGSDEEDIDSSETADFVRPKTKDVKKTPKLKTTYFIDEGGKFGSDEYEHGESYSLTEPIGGKSKKKSKKPKNKANNSKPATPISLESSSREDTTEVVGPKSIHVGFGGDSIVELPLDSIEQNENGSKSNQNMKSASTEVGDVQHGTPENEDLEDDDLEDVDEGETPESREKAADDDEDDESSPKKDSDETSSENDKNKNVNENVVPKDTQTDEKNSTKEDGTTKPDGTESKPVTFEEFKAGLSEDELAFFRDEDDDEDIGLDDSAAEGEDDDDEENSEKPRKKSMKASKSVHIVRHPPESEEFGGSSSRGALDSDEDKITVNYTANLEADFKPKKSVKVVRSQITEEKHPEDDYEYYEDDDDDLDMESEPPTRNNAQGPTLQSDSSETRSDTAKKPQGDDVLAQEPDDDSFDYYEDDDHDDYEDSGSEKNQNPPTSMSAEESKEQPNLMVDTSTRGSNTARPSSQENNSDDRSQNSEEKDSSASSETEKGEDSTKNRGGSNEDSQSNEGKEESSQETEKGENGEEREVGNENKPDGPPNSNISSGDILPFESAESAVEQKTQAELAFDEKVEALKASAGHPPELTVLASNTEQTKTALNSSLESLHTSPIIANTNGSLTSSAPLTRTQLGVSSMLNPSIAAFTTPTSTVGSAEKPSATSSPTLTVDQWTPVPPPASVTSSTRPPNYVVLKKPSKPTTSSVIMTIPSSNSAPRA